MLVVYAGEIAEDEITRDGVDDSAGRETVDLVFKDVFEARVFVGDCAFKPGVEPFDKDAFRGRGRLRPQYCGRDVRAPCRSPCCLLAGQCPAKMALPEFQQGRFPRSTGGIALRFVSFFGEKQRKTEKKA